MSEGPPESISLHLDAGTRRSDRGRTLVGGSPLRVLRVTDQGASIVDDFAAGRPVGAAPVRRALARRLLDAGMAHPVPLGSSDLRVAIVIPVRDHATQLSLLLDALTPDGPEVVVVDDGSLEPDTIVSAVAGRGRVIRHQSSRGPAAARNTGWRACHEADVIAFVDADVIVPDGWLQRLTAHFVDPAVGGVAPRVRGGPDGNSMLDRYEHVHSPLDLGPSPARVAPGCRVSYVPTATILFRRRLLDLVGGFDEAMRVGEDVDLVWRIVDAGWTVRYEPVVEVVHDNRPGWGALARQRFGYGTSAAALDRRHPGAVAPVVVNAWSLAAWMLGAMGGRRGAALGIGVAAASGALLVPDLKGKVDDPVVETVRLAGLGHLWAGRWLSSALLRAWWPLAVIAALRSRRARRVLLVAATAPNVIEWLERRPALDPLRWLVARLLDDVSYGAGVWVGCWRARSWHALRPALSGIPGLGRRSGR